MTDTTPDRDPLLDRLADTWSRHDPVPDGLVERALATVRAGLGSDVRDDLDAELELLVLLERSEELAGTRAGGDQVTLHFTGRLGGPDGELELLLRVTPLSAEECRVDGWLSPDAGFSVTAVQGRRRTAAVVSGPGRFEFPALRRGETRLVVATGPDAGPAGTAPGLLGTHPFDL